MKPYARIQEQYKNNTIAKTFDPSPIVIVLKVSPIYSTSTKLIKIKLRKASAFDPPHCTWLRPRHYTLKLIKNSILQIIQKQRIFNQML